MTCMHALYGLPRPENTHRSLRTFYDSLEFYVRGLESLEKASVSYCDLLVCILFHKLPGELRKNLARQHDQDEWTLEELGKSLRSEIRVLEAGQGLSTPHQACKVPHQSTSLFSRKLFAAIVKASIFLIGVPSTQQLTTV